MTRRFISLFAALLALVAVHSAWAAPWACYADVQQRACHCSHEPGVAEVGDACCTREQVGATLAAGVTLPAPLFAAVRLPVPVVLAPVARAEAAPPPILASLAAPRGPPATPLFLALRTLLI